MSCAVYKKPTMSTMKRLLGEDVRALEVAYERDPHVLDGTETYHVVHTAVMNDNREMVRALFRLDPACLHRTNGDGWSALHFAAYNNRVELIRMICAEMDGSGVDALTARSRTPMHLAAMSAHFEAVAMLRRMGSKADAMRDAGGKTPADYQQSAFM